MNLDWFVLTLNRKKVIVISSFMLRIFYTHKDASIYFQWMPLFNSLMSNKQRMLYSFVNTQLIHYKYISQYRIASITAFLANDDVY